MNAPLLSLLAVALLGSMAAVAQTPIKSVDREGNVTYSDKPLPDAVKAEAVPLAPPPGEEEVQAAKERLEKNRKMLEEAGKERQARKKEREAARRAAQAARPEVTVIHEDAGGYHPWYVHPPLIPPSLPDRPGYHPRPPTRPGTPGQRPPDNPAYRPPNMQPR